MGTTKYAKINTSRSSFDSNVVYFLLFLLLLSFKWNYRKSFFMRKMGLFSHLAYLICNCVHYLLPYTLSDATMTLELSNQYVSELSRELTKTVCSEAAYLVSEYKVQTLYSGTSTFWKKGVFSMYLTRAPSVNAALWASLCKFVVVFVVFSYF